MLSGYLRLCKVRIDEQTKIEGIKKVIPAKISYSSTRGISQPIIRFQRETIPGFKLIAHSRGAIQEIFVVVDSSKKNDIGYKLREMMEDTN